jgi:Flp pilus assembly protein TadG
MNMRIPAVFRNQRGQALIETGFVVALLATLTMGIVEAGRAMMTLNMITNVARDAARLAAGTGPAGRDAAGNITNAYKTTVCNQANTQLSAVDSTLTNLCTVGNIQQITLPDSTLPVVQVTLSGTVHLMFNLLGGDITVSRVATFRDEGK